MEAMLSMKRLIESNTATVAAASTAAEADPTHPSAMNQAHQPASDMVGRGGEVLGTTGGPHMGYNLSSMRSSFSLPSTIEGGPPTEKCNGCRGQG